MRVPRPFILPAVLVAAIGAWIAAGHSAGDAGSGPGATATSAPAAATATPVVPESLPAGVTGSLTYRSGRELVTVKFLTPADLYPEAVEVGRKPVAFDAAGATRSADGEWSVEVECGRLRPECDLWLAAQDGEPARVQTPYFNVMASEWSPTGHVLALIGTDNRAGGNVLAVIDDPAQPALREIAVAPFVALAWRGAREIITAVRDDAQADVRAVTLDGASRALGRAASQISYFYPSPDRTRFAFTQQDARGWRMSLLDASSAAIIDLGNMGSDGPDGQPVTVPPGEGKGPMAVSWSPDGRYLAFGGGFEPPYTMTIVDTTGRADPKRGGIARATFPSGYPGEMRWSPDGRLLAVSTYDVDRTHHETWVVEPGTGAGRHLMDGCVIVWSPEGKFLAVHGEDLPGISIVDVESGERGRITYTATDVPVAWVE